jgi:DNA-binding MarR family transcriptional regulator
MIMKISRKGGYYISRIQRISSRILAQKLRENHITLTPAQGRLLFILWDTPGINVKELAKRASLSKSTTSVLLKKLKSEGHVSIDHPPGNDRQKIITYREKDETLEQVYQQISEEMNHLFYYELEEKQILEFEKNLEQIYTRLTKYEEDEM